MVGTVQPPLKFVDVDHRRLDLAEQDGVVAVALAVVAPDDPVGEDLEEGGDHALGRLQVALVERDPEAHDPARVQVIAAHLVVFHRVQRGAALDPRVDRVGGDDVELLAGGAEEVPAVVVDDLDLLAIDRVGVLAGDAVDDVVILLAEHRRHDRRHQRLDVADDDPLDVGVQDEACRR